MTSINKITIWSTKNLWLLSSNIIGPKHFNDKKYINNNCGK